MNKVFKDGKITNDGSKFAVETQKAETQPQVKFSQTLRSQINPTQPRPSYNGGAAVKTNNCDAKTQKQHIFNTILNKMIYSQSLMIALHRDPLWYFKIVQKYKQYIENRDDFEDQMKIFSLEALGKANSNLIRVAKMLEIAGVAQIMKIKVKEKRADVSTDQEQDVVVENDNNNSNSNTVVCQIYESITVRMCLVDFDENRIPATAAAKKDHYSHRNTYNCELQQQQYSGQGLTYQNQAKFEETRKVFTNKSVGEFSNRPDFSQAAKNNQEKHKYNSRDKNQMIRKIGKAFMPDFEPQAVRQPKKQLRRYNDDNEFDSQSAVTKTQATEKLKDDEVVDCQVAQPSSEKFFAESDSENESH